MPRIFISYRRKNAGWQAPILKDRLDCEFGEDSAILDFDSFVPGVDFRRQIFEAVSSCDVLLAMIDRDWLDVRNEKGERRLEDPGDFVRLEIEAALKRDIPVIPLLVDDAKIPEARDLPESLVELPYRHGMLLRRPPDLEGDVDRLVLALRAHAERESRAREELVDYERQWASGDWRSAHRLLEELLKRVEILGTSRYRPLSSQFSRLATLLAAWKAFEARDFAEAQRLLSEDGDETAPPNVALAREVASLGLRVGRAIATGDPDAIECVQSEFAELRAEAERSGCTIVPGERELDAELKDAQREVAYREGLELYAQGRFAEAATRFTELGEYKEARDRIGACTAWDHVGTAVSEKRWDDARELLKDLREKEESARVERVRQWCLRARLFTPALEAMLAGCHLEAAGIATELGAAPYSLLSIGPDATSQHCMDLGFELQAQPDGMTPEQRAAWDTLRRAESRMEADFGLFAVRDPARAGQVLERLCTLGAALQADAPPAPEDAEEPPESLWSRIATDLGDDGGVFLALMASDLGDHDAALDRFLAQAREAPGDPQPLHHLGLTATAKASSQYAGGEDCSEALGVAVVSLAAVFADDRWWRRWWGARKRVYPIASEQVDAARQGLLRAWGDRLRAFADAQPDVELRFQVELGGARAVQRGGGIPIRASTGESAGKEHAVVGLGGARALGLAETITAWTGSLSFEDLEPDDWRQRVRLFFSELATGTVLAAEERFEEAVAVLSETGTAPTLPFEETNPSLAALPQRQQKLEELRDILLRDSHQGAAAAALTQAPIPIERVLEHWSEAIRIAIKSHGEEASMALIRDAVVGRAAFLLRMDQEDRLESLNDAVRLLQEVVDRQWGDREGLVQDALVGALLARAVHLSNEYDMEKEARFDAQRAWSLAPRSLRVLVVLCFASLHYARQLHIAGQRDLAKTVMKEVDRHLENGLDLYPEDAELAKAATFAQQMHEEMDSGSGALAGVLADLRSVTRDSAEAESSQRLTEGLLHEARQEYSEATGIYWDLYRADPSRESIGNKMAWCYRAWIVQVHNQGDMLEARRILGDARERCPPSAGALMDLPKELRAPVQDPDHE